MVTFDPYEECAVCGRFHYVGGSESKPLQRSADPIECVLLERDGKRTVYRVSRKVVIG